MNNSWTIKQKILASLIFVSSITLFVGGIGFLSLNHVATKYTEIQKQYEQQRLIGEISTSINSLKSSINAIAIPRLTSAQFQSILLTLGTDREIYKSALDKLPPMLTESSEKDNLKEFEKYVGQWRDQNNTVVDIVKQLEEQGLRNPVALMSQIQQFRADHYAVIENLHKFLQFRVPISGGEDPKLCNLGKWIETVHTSIPEIKAALQQIIPVHNDFHSSVKHAKELATKGDNEAALEVYNAKVELAMENSIAALESLRKIVESASSSYDKVNNLLLNEISMNSATALEVLHKMSEAASAKITNLKGVVEESKKSAEFWMLVAIFCGGVVSIFLGWRISSRISIAIAQVIQKLDSSSSQLF